MHLLLLHRLYTTHVASYVCCVRVRWFTKMCVILKRARLNESKRTKHGDPSTLFEGVTLLQTIFNE